MIKGIIKKLIYRIRGEYTIDQLRKMGLTVGENFNPQLGFELDPSHCWLIEIGEDVTFGPHVQVLAHDASMYHHLGYTRIGKVVIGNNVFVGAGSIILPNVKIGDNVIIGAGSIVTQDIPENVVCAGNPAKILDSVDNFIAKHKKCMNESPVYDESYTLRKKITNAKKSQQKKDLGKSGGYVK